MKGLAQRISVFISLVWLGMILEIVKAAALGVYGFLSLFRREQGHD